MMTKQIWLNLPVKDIKQSKKFFSENLFSCNNELDTKYSACLLGGEYNLVTVIRPTKLL